MMTGTGEFMELQGTAEGQTFDRSVLDQQLELAVSGIAQLTRQQQDALGDAWPLDSNEATC